MPQLENIEAIERRLWSAADQLRANSNYASNEYFLPVMGLVFLRHAYSRFLAVKDDLEANLPSRGGVKRALTKEDFSQKSSIYLRPEAQFDNLVALPTGANMARAIIRAMESIEEDYETLRGVLPKSEYQELDDDTLRNLLRTLNPDELKKVSGDVFGRIYEYFLTQFADQKAHDGGEFFTPISLVQFIANVLEPDSGTVFDPACGSGGMFVQSARVVEQHNQNPAERLTFRGLEKNGTTINLAKMNLAVHGLEGDIQKAITYYEDPLDLFSKCDYVMANPPFNVDEVDAEKVKNDPRLPFGLPGVNNKGKVSNGNYLWISYFYSYLNEKGRAGFVMSSQASGAGRDEATVRRKLVEAGAVELMVSIRSNFFYTRAVPCELWFLNKAKPAEHRNKVLMLDARNVYRKVTRKIYDFSPEQLQNLLSIVWLYRGESKRFWDLVKGYLISMCDVGQELESPSKNFEKLCGDCLAKLSIFDVPTIEHKAYLRELEEINEASNAIQAYFGNIDQSGLIDDPDSDLSYWTEHWNEEPISECRDLMHKVESFTKSILKVVAELRSTVPESMRQEFRSLDRSIKILEEYRSIFIEQLKLCRYFHRQAHWLLERFPEGELRDVEGLVKLVDHEELAKNDWSLTPGRYVGVAPEVEDEDFDFEEAIRAIHEELSGLNDEAVELASAIATNLETLVG